MKDQLHNENMAQFKSKLDSNPKLSDTQRAEILDHYETQYRENLSHEKTQRVENRQFFNQVADDPNMTQEQRKQAIREHFNTQKQENIQEKQQQKIENKAEKKKIKSEIKNIKKTQPGQ
mgnify:CR=1 FL=1